MLLFEPDLLFSSRIESASSKVGLDLKVITRVNELEQALMESAPWILLVNLDASRGGGKDWAALIQGRCRVIGYYSHLDSSLAEEALADGFDMVIPRRALVRRLGEIFADIGSS